MTINTKTLDKYPERLATDPEPMEAYERTRSRILLCLTSRHLGATTYFYICTLVNSLRTERLNPFYVSNYYLQKPKSRGPVCINYSQTIRYHIAAAEIKTKS